MPGVLENDLGRIVLSEDLIASIAGYAAMENSGIVGMKSKSASAAFFQFIGGNNQKRGIVVSSGDAADTVDIDMYVTFMYGVSLPAVAQNTMSNVRYRVEDMTGLKVGKVNIHVEAIKV